MHADVVVIGAGQAGLSAAYALRRAGADFVVLDGNPRPGGAWQHRWPSLRLDRAHRIHPLPGMPLPDADPADPAADVVARYFAGYERHFQLPVRRHGPSASTVGANRAGQTAVRELLRTLTDDAAA